LDDGRPRFNLGVDVAKRLRSADTALRIPWVNSLRMWKAHICWDTAPKTVLIGSG
jgi:hypothetical protein